TRARPGLRPIALSTPANGSLRMPNPAKDQKREEKVLAKLPEICLGLPQAREVKTWRPTCRRSRVTKRRGAKARRQCRQGIWKCIRLSRTNREISGGTADSGTETERSKIHGKSAQSRLASPIPPNPHCGHVVHPYRMRNRRPR